MNVVVATYYGHVDPSQLEGEVDVSVPLALRRLWCAGASNTKVSFIHEDRLQKVSADLSILGGREKASAAIDQARDWLTAWDEGEKQGKASAHAVMQSYFEEAWSKQSQAQPTATREELLDAEISRIVRMF